MRTPEEMLEALGNRVRLAEESELERLQSSRHVRARLMTAQQPRPASEVWRLAAFAAMGAVLGGLVISVIGQLREAPLSFRLDAPSAGPSQLGVPLHATTEPGALIRFSDGSSIRMQEGAQTRVAAVDERGARVLVDRGRIGVDVVHQAASRWTFEAGPFEVTVTGTRFEMSWEPATQAFELSMTEGAVVVSGCSLAGVGAVAGQSVRATCVRDHGELEFITPGASSAIVSRTPATGPEERNIVPVPLAVSASPGPAAPAQMDQELVSSPQEAPAAAESAALPTWQSLVAAGRYREAYELADRAGFDQECERAGASDLLALSEAALFSQRTDRTRAALLKLRARFPGSNHAATAAFRLGRLAFDTQGAYAEARQWFTTYLSEQPGGGFAREATGRLIEVEYRSGNLPSAKHLAERYLQSWPAGPHAPLARSLSGD